MPLFMDRHDLLDATAEQVAEMHMLDLAVAAKHNVEFLSYWFDPYAGAVFSLAEAPTPADVAAVHAESHGLVPNRIIAVGEDSVLKFLGNIEEPVGPSLVTSPFRTILFTDLVGSTEMLDRLGQDAYLSLLAEHDLIIRRSVVASQGREVKHTGDGIMASFNGVGPALSCALGIQQGFAERNAHHGRHQLEVRIGLAAGEPVDRDDDLFGSTVTLASRICDAAQAGQILVSQIVHDLGVPLGFAFAEPEQRDLKGFRDPIAVFALRARSRNGGP